MRDLFFKKWMRLGCELHSNSHKNQNRRDADSRFDFMDELKKEEHFPEKYKNTDGLVRSLEKDIEHLARN